MRASSYMGKHQRSHAPKGLRTIILLIVGVALAFGGIVWFRKHAPAPVDAAQKEPSENVVSLAPSGEAPLRRDRQETQVYNVDHVGLATASREVLDRVFHHTVVAHLSDPPEGKFYEGWLLRDEPFGFFSTGAMVKNADGTFALIWDGERGKDFQDYPKIIITLESDDGDPAPSLHVLEGEF